MMGIMIKKFLIKETIDIQQALKSINSTGEKSIIIIDKNKNFLGVLSDGDVRRALLKGYKIKDKIKNIYNKKAFFVKKKNLSNKKILNYFLKGSYDLIPVIENKKVTKIFFRSKIFSLKNQKKETKKFNKINNKLIIMAGGKGSRLSPLTSVLPKPLLPINNKPIISHILEKFKKNGVRNFIVSINKANSIIKSYIKNFLQKDNIDFIEETKPLGTIGSLSLLKKTNKPFFVTNCDVLFDFDLNELVKLYNTQKPDIIIVTVNIKNKIPYGVSVTDSKNNLINIKEKPTYLHNIIGGLYMINPKVLKLIPKNKLFDFTDLIKKVKKNRGKVITFAVSQTKWNDIGEFAPFKRTLEKLK